jgi:hypothetical protein
LKCFEKITDYINTAAFSYMAVSGDNFCSSAWSGFMLNMTYGLEFVWANTLASAFVLLSKVFIVVINIFCLKLAMDARGDTEEVKSVGGPYLVCAIASYFTANLFLGMMDETVVALLTSLCVDEFSTEVLTAKEMSNSAHQLSMTLSKRCQKIRKPQMATLTTK